MKVALVHDFLKEYGGAERVLEALHGIFPEAPVYTAFVDWKGLGPHGERIKKWDIRPSWVQKNWLVRKLHSPLRFLAPLIWESFNFDDYNLVISSSGWFICRGIITRPETLHICYLHHPPRHLYGYKTALEWQKYRPVRIYGAVINHFLRIYDFIASQRVDYFIANSKETARRIKKFYRRDSTVIYPPVKISNVTRRFGGQTSNVKKEYFLSVSRLARAKNIHLAIEACNKLGESLLIVGQGREERYLRSIAGPTVKFSGEVTDEKLWQIYQRAKALIFPAEDEEFGIVPIEAMSFGVPVIAYRSGGVMETIIERKTGFFFDELKVESLTGAIKDYIDYNNYNNMRENCLKQAQKFSQERFFKEIREFVSKHRLS